MRRWTEHNFSQVPKADIRRSVFDRSHCYKTAMNASWLVPFYVDEVLPGDTFSLKATLFGRLATPITPIMDNLYLESFFFFVPNRLVWDNWQKFMGEKENPSDEISYLVPVIGDFVAVESSLADYMGLPIGCTLRGISALPFRAYNLIWNEWFRDENLQDSRTVPKGDGHDSITLYGTLKRGKRHDYFTSCLPWPQKGEAQNIGIGGTADIFGDVNGFTDVFWPLRGKFQSTETSTQWNANMGLATPVSGSYLYPTLQTTGNFSAGDPTGYYEKVGVRPNEFPRGMLKADLSDSSVLDINTFRAAFQVQRLLERNARSGTRYTEILRGHFGVQSPDARLQRPEYLGGSSSRISINPVEQTGSTDDVSPQGNLAAYGVAGDSFHGFTKSFVEHGYVIGLVSIRGDLSYQQGTHKMWKRSTKYDFYWPVLAHLGEQAVLNGELYTQGTDEDDEIFGYQERWAEYRYFPAQITGQFRSTNSESLDVWHLGENFTGCPVLNSSFIVDQTPVDRVVAVSGQPHFLFDSYLQLKCVRAMPVYSVPGYVDHF